MATSALVFNLIARWCRPPNSGALIMVQFLSFN